MNSSSTPPLSTSELLEIQRWNTPTIYNGWEQLTHGNAAADAFNLEETKDFMPHMGPMAGWAVTVAFEPSNSAHKTANPHAWSDYRAYVASLAGPKIVIVQDLDKPRVIGAFWGEVNSSIHRSLGCIGTIVDGAIRDLDEMNAAGFKALARRLCVGHAHSTPVRWGCEVEVFGRKIRPGQFIHADKHGFLAIPEGEEKGLLEAARFMDANECKTILAAARSPSPLTPQERLADLDAAGAAFRRNCAERFARKGEW